MIKDRALWEAWEAQYIASELPDFRRNLQIFEAMYEYPRSPGASLTPIHWTGRNPESSWREC